MSGVIVEMMVSGVPETKGSWIGLEGGAMKADNPREKGWSHAVGWAARAQLRAKQPTPARVRVDIAFRLPPPKGRKNQRDLDKLLRSCLDAMNKLVYVDDEQVDLIVAEKLVTDTDHGARITVREHNPHAIDRLTSFASELAAEPCEYGDECPDFGGTRHGMCLHCKARRALGVRP